MRLHSSCPECLKEFDISDIPFHEQFFNDHSNHSEFYHSDRYYQNSLQIKYCGPIHFFDKIKLRENEMTSLVNYREGAIHVAQTLHELDLLLSDNLEESFNWATMMEDVINMDTSQDYLCGLVGFFEKALIKKANSLLDVLDLNQHHIIYNPTNEPDNVLIQLMDVCILLREEFNKRHNSIEQLFT